MALLLAMLALSAFGFYLQPINGDLVRLGGYSERDYGWNLPQQGFTQPRYNSDSYSQYYDMVVWGDSFSDSKTPCQWQNYLAAATDLSITTLSHRNGVKFDEILNNPIFRQSPPKLFIYERVERATVTNSTVLNNIKCPIALDAPHNKRVEQKISQVNFPIVWQDYLTNDLMLSITRQIDLRTIKFDELFKHTKNYSIQNFLRNTFDIETTKVAKHRLTRPAPFSSLNTLALLTYNDDLLKLKQTAKHVEVAVCELESMRRQVEANGYTRFIYMIPPDKTTAYADFLADENLRHISFIPKLAEQSPSVIPRLDAPLQAAIQAGEMDIYLPDNTHWGWRGHQIAAETLLKFLNNP